MTINPLKNLNRRELIPLFIIAVVVLLFGFILLNPNFLEDLQHTLSLPKGKVIYTIEGAPDFAGMQFEVDFDTGIVSGNFNDYKLSDLPDRPGSTEARTRDFNFEGELNKETGLLSVNMLGTITTDSNLICGPLEYRNIDEHSVVWSHDTNIEANLNDLGSFVAAAISKNGKVRITNPSEEEIFGESRQDWYDTGCVSYSRKFFSEWRFYSLDNWVAAPEN